MGIQRGEALGRNRRFMAASQATIGTRPTFAATDSFIALGHSIVPSEERIKRRNPQSSRSLRERYVGSRSAEVTIVCEHLPRGGATPPDYGVLLTAGLGVQTVGGSDVTYSLSNTQTLPFVWFEVDAGLNTSTTAEYKEAADGFVVEQVKISISKDDIPKIEFSGPCHNFVQTGRAVAENLSGGETDIPLATNEHSRFFAVNSVVGIGTSTNTGAGHRVTAVDHTAGELTVTPAVAAGAQTAPAVWPISLWTEAQTGGSPTPHVVIAVDLGADTGAWVDALEITVKNNITQRRIIGNPWPADSTPGFRDVDGTVTISATRNDIQKILNSSHHNIANVSTFDIVVTIGESGQAGSILSLDNCELDWSGISWPEDGTVGTATIPFTCKSDSATAESEVSWVWQTLP